MTVIPGFLRAEYFYDRPKMGRYNFYLALTILVGIFAAGFFQEGLYQTSAYVFAPIIFILFSYFTWSASINPAHIKIYNNGLDIKSWGFLAWDKVHCLSTDGKIHLQIPLSLTEFNLLRRPAGCFKCRYNSEIAAAEVTFIERKFIENIPLNNISAAIVKSAPSSSLSPINRSPKSPRQKLSYFFWGDRSTSVAQKIFAVFGYAILGIILYYLVSAPIFIPSKVWHDISLILVYMILILWLGRFIIARRNGTFSAGEKISTPALLLFVPLAMFLIPTLISVAIIHAPGSIVNQLRGHEFRDLVYVADKYTATKSSKCGYKIKSIQLKRASTFTDLCINQVNYDLIPTQGGIIGVGGKQSWFGRTIERYSVPPIDSPLHVIARKGYMHIYEKWEVDDLENKRIAKEQWRLNRKK